MRLEDLALPGAIYRGTVALLAMETQTRFQIVDGVLFYESSNFTWEEGADAAVENFWVDAQPLHRVNGLTYVRPDVAPA